MPASVPHTTIDLLRHGEPDGGPRYRGHRDDPLTELGWRQMSAAVDGLGGSEAGWSQIVSSPLQRCADFARQLAGQSGLPLALEPDLREIHFGQWEGKDSAQLLREDPHRLQRYWADPQAVTPPGGESLARFQQRVGRAWTRLLQRHSGGHLLLITHGGVMRVLLNTMLGIPPRAMFGIHIPYASLSRLRVEHHPDGDRSHWLLHRGAD